MVHWGAFISLKSDNTAKLLRGDKWIESVGSVISGAGSQRDLHLHKLTIGDMVRSGNVLPQYPELALERGWQGTVELKLSLKEDGSVKQSVVKSSSGFSILDEVARKASEQWKFEHYKKYKIIITPIKFTIDS